MPKSAPETGVPKTAAKPALMPQITSRRRSASSSPRRSEKREVSAAPIWAAGPSLPTDPPKASVRTVAAELHGRDTPVDPPRALVHRGNDRLSAMAPGVGREGPDQPDTAWQRQRQQPEGRKGALGEPVDEGGRGRERPEKTAGSKTDTESGRGAQQGPLQGADQERGVFGIPATLIGQPRRPGLKMKTRSS